MKIFAFLAIAEASVWIHPEVQAANKALGIRDGELPGKCFFECTIEAARESIRCDLKYDPESEELAACYDEANQNWENCVTVDGCVQVS